MLHVVIMGLRNTELAIHASSNPWPITFVNHHDCLGERPWCAILPESLSTSTSGRRVPIDPSSPNPSKALQQRTGFLFASGEDRRKPASGVLGALSAPDGLVGILIGGPPGRGDACSRGHPCLHLGGVQGWAGDLRLLVLQHCPVKDVVPLQTCTSQFLASLSRPHI